MSSTTTSTFAITVYGGFPIFICGTLGNLLNILLFWRVRRNPCGFIFLVTSLINCVVLFYGLFLRILTIGFGHDWSTTNLIWCKTRAYFTAASFLISLTWMCLGSIDRFLLSCRREKYRKLSRLSFAISAVVITTLFWLVHFLPYLFDVQIVKNPYTRSMTCMIPVIDAYIKYIMYVSYPLYYGFLPTAILTTTGLLTFRNVTQLHALNRRQQAQKQLTLMMLTQIPIIIISTLPYTIFSEYKILTSTVTKSNSQTALETTVTDIVTILCYITFASPFYTFLISSKSFREEAKLVVLFWKRNQAKLNRIQPWDLSISNSMKLATTRANQHFH